MKDIDNGITAEMVDRELLYARVMTELIYNISNNKRRFIEIVYYLLSRLKLMRFVKKVLKLLNLEHKVKILFKRNKI